MRLNAKLRISYVGIILVAVSLVLVLIIENSQRDLKEKIAKDFEAVAKIEAENIDHYMNGKLAQIRVLAQDKVFSSGDVDTITRYLNRVRKDNSSYLDISLIDRSRNSVVSTDPQKAGKVWGDDPELFEDVSKAAWGEVLFTYGYGAGRSIQGFVITRLPDKIAVSGAYVLAASIDMKKILKDNGEAKTLAGEIGFLVNNQSTMVVTRDGDAQTFTPLVYIQEDSSLKGVGRASGHTVYRDPERGVVIAGYAYLNENCRRSGRWSVISMAPEKEVFYPAIRLRNRMIVLAVIAVAVAWILAFFVARGIARPVKRLVEVTDLIAGGDLSQRADIDQDDEVGDLARSFNKMTDNLNITIVARDQEIIERQNAEERLKEEMEAKAKFISLISNEFRTPLTVIREGIGNLLAESSGNIDPHQQGLLQIARKSGESLSHLVNDIVEFHSLEAEIVKLRLEDNDINAVAAHVHDIMLPLLAEKKDVKFSLALDKTVPKVVFDRERITLVLTNVINMALKTTSKGSVTVRTVKDGDNAICVTVEDLGSTLDKDMLPTLFDKFDRLGKDSDKMAGGTGLGLTLSREIVKRHNGKIWAEALDGGGIEICFTLPLSKRRV